MTHNLHITHLANHLLEINGRFRVQYLAYFLGILGAVRLEDEPMPDHSHTVLPIQIDTVICDLAQLALTLPDTHYKIILQPLLQHQPPHSSDKIDSEPSIESNIQVTEPNRSLAMMESSCSFRSGDSSTPKAEAGRRPCRRNLCECRKEAANARFRG